MTERTPLSQQMHALADTGHARGVELRERADAFDTASRGVVAGWPDTMKRMLGAWARARRCWSECSGEPLL